MPVAINSLKTANKSFVDFGDIITYTITILNSGDTAISNVFFVDTLPTQVTFTTNSVFINNTQSIGFIPNIPMTLPNILPNETTTISFECGVNTTFPLPSSFSNLGNLLYSYTLTSTNFRQSDLTNQSSITLNKAILGVDKYTGDFTGLNYPLPTTIVITNFGNTLATDLVLTEILDYGMSVDLLSLKEDNISISGNPISGVSLNNLSSNGVKTIFYNLLVNSLPSNGFVETYNNLSYSYKVDPTSTVKSTSLTGSYYELTTVSSAVLSTTYSVIPNISVVGATVTYSLTIQNIGNTTAQYINVFDSLPSSLSFVSGSVFINGSNFPSYNPTISISIPNLSSNGVSTLTFVATITTLPNINPFENTALLSYKSQIPNSVLLNSLSTITNSTFLSVNSNELLFNKYANSYFYTLGDTITYTLTVLNQGTIDLFNCILYDTLPSNLVFINGSVQINGITSSDNPSLGISLYTIPKSSISTIVFSAKVTN